MYQPSSANIFNILLVFTTFTIQKHFIFNIAKIVKILRYYIHLGESYEQNYEQPNAACQRHDILVTPHGTHSVRFVWGTARTCDSSVSKTRNY